MKVFERARGTVLWVVLLTATSAIATLALACAMPFAALAAIGATRMSVRAGAVMMALGWAMNQAIGFGILGYPQDATTIAWGGAMLTAALASLAAARWGEARVASSGAAWRLATAFGTGFIGWKVALLGWSFVLGGVHTALSPYWTATQFGREAVTVAVLVALYEGLVAIGLPAAARLRHA